MFSWATSDVQWNQVHKLLPSALHPGTISSGTHCHTSNYFEDIMSMTTYIAYINDRELASWKPTNIASGTFCFISYSNSHSITNHFWPCPTLWQYEHHNLYQMLPTGTYSTLLSWNCREISKFSDTNTNARHVQTCRKKAQKVPNFRAKKTYFQACFFCALYSSCPKESINAIKNEKCQYFFSPGHRLVCPTYEILQKVGVVTNANVSGILWHLANITICPWHVNDITNKATLCPGWYPYHQPATPPSLTLTPCSHDGQLQLWCHPYTPYLLGISNRV